MASLGLEWTETGKPAADLQITHFESKGKILLVEVVLGVRKATVSIEWPTKAR